MRRPDSLLPILFEDGIGHSESNSRIANSKGDSTSGGWQSLLTHRSSYHWYKKFIAAIMGSRRARFDSHTSSTSHVSTSSPSSNRKTLHFLCPKSVRLTSNRIVVLHVYASGHP